MLSNTNCLEHLDCFHRYPPRLYQDSSAVHVQDIMNHIPTLNNVMFFFCEKCQVSENDDAMEGSVGVTRHTVLMSQASVSDHASDIE
jgi:hypothetical protein